MIATVGALTSSQPAVGQDLVQLPLGQQVGSAAVTSAGVGLYTAVWHGATGLGQVGGPFIRLPGMRDGYVGKVVPRSDGGAWVILNYQDVGRWSPDGTIVRYGPLRISGNTEFGQAAAVGSDGSLLATVGANRILRIADNGGITLRMFAPPAPPDDRVFHNCFYTDMVVTATGVIYLSDYGCARIVAIDPDGSTRALNMNPASPERRQPAQGLALANDGTLWFAGTNVIGRFNADGTVTRISTPSTAPDLSGEVAASPDGAVWATGYCSLIRIANDQASVYPVGFPAVGISFFADGRALVSGASRITRGNPQALPTAGERCDKRLPRLTTHPALSIGALRRHPTITLTVDEPSTVEGAIYFTSPDLTGNFGKVAVNRIVRLRQGRGTVRLHIPDRLLRAAARRLGRGEKPALEFLMDAIDASGNVGYPNAKVAAAYPLRR